MVLAQVFAIGFTRSIALVAASFASKSPPIEVSSALPARVVVSVAPSGAESVGDDVRDNLARLTSANGAERFRAQRWLTAHLESPRDIELIVATLRLGDAEVRGRIEAALGDDDRHLDLASALASEENDIVASVGRGAITEMVERWSPGSKRVGKLGPSVFTSLREGRERPIEIDASFATRPLEDVISLLAQYAPRAPEIAIDPTVESEYSNAQLKAQAFTGPFDRVLNDLLAARGLECEGFGLGDDAPSGATTWLCVVARGRDTARTGTEVIVNWCVASRQPGDDPLRSKDDDALRSRAVRALAATTWPAANAWLARRWVDHGDIEALDGLGIASLRSGVPAALTDPRQQAKLRQLLDLSLASDDQSLANGWRGPRRRTMEDLRRAWYIANLLGATGVTGPQGEDLAVAALEGRGWLTGRSMWLRLVEFEGRRSNSPAVAAVVDGWITQVDVEPAVRLEALRVRRIATVAASNESPVTASTAEKGAENASVPIARLDRLVEWASTADRLDELANILRARPGSVPDAWRDPTVLPATWGGLARALVVEGWLVRRELDVAALHLAHLAANSDAPSREAAWMRLRNFTDSDVDRTLVAAFTRALVLPEANVGQILRGAAISGAALNDDLAQRALDAITAESSNVATLKEREDLIALGALAAGPRGKRARTALVQASTGSGAPRDRLDALDRAVAEIRGLRDRSSEQAFLREVRAAAREGDPTWRSKVRVDVWPAPPPIEPLRLADFDRSFARAGF